MTRWEDERYVRLYTRDTADWMGLSWDAQALLMHLFRKVDRAGALPLGKHGKKAVAIVLGQLSAWDRLAPALEELLVDGCVCILDGGTLFIPNFLAAQEAVQSDAQRKRDQREREQARLFAASRDVTKRDGMSRDVTSGHAESRAVTPSVPSLAVPSRAEPSSVSAGADPVGAFGGVPVQQVLEGALPDRRISPQKRGKHARRESDSPPDPRHHPLKLRLVAVFLEVRGADYAFTARDAKALKGLLSRGSDEEIEARWRRGLNGQYRERCDTIADLEQRWNSLTGQTGPPGKIVDIRKAPVRAEDINPESFKETGRAEF